jgi:diguanylate cyclase (GGDEF)-like protein
MRLFGRNDIVLLGGLAVALFIVFSQPLGKMFDFVREIEDTYQVQLLPAFMILVALYSFHQVRKREEVRVAALASASAAAEATSRAEEMERLIAFSQAIARSLTEESIKAAAVAHIPQLAPNRVAWALARTDGQWRPLMNVGDVTPLAQESAAKIALCEIDPPPGVEPEFTCFPMIIAGMPVGVLGVAAKPGMADDQRRILTTAAALLAVSLKNSELFREVVESNVRDPLTACVTRRHGMGIFQTEMRRARRSQLPMALIVFDLDHFKAVNDRYGHLAGDAVLGAVGGRMNAVLRGSDLKCRYGGEEFLILLPDTPAQGAQRVAETLRREIEANAIPWNDEQLRITASFGVTAITPGEMDPLAAIARADEALYRAKQDGRNCVRTAAEAEALV